MFINKTVDRPCKASRRAIISCRGSEDEMDVVEGQEDDNLVFKCREKYSC